MSAKRPRSPVSKSTDGGEAASRVFDRRDGPGDGPWRLGRDTLVGAPRHDKLIGGPGRKLVGRPGNDMLIGGPGDDTLIGGPGNDIASRAAPGSKQPRRPR